MVKSVKSVKIKKIILLTFSVSFDYHIPKQGSNK